MTAIDPDLQKLIDESERLMAEAEGLTLTPCAAVKEPTPIA